jgi:hypothetical protein
VLRQRDADPLDRIIGGWLADRHPDGWGHLAMDGKVLRGSRDGEVPGVHRLAGFAPQVAAVVGQMTVEAGTNEHKTALRWLGVLPPLNGAVVTADAMVTHADGCAGVRERGGEYVLYAKGNQTRLRDDIATTFATAAGGHFSPHPAGAVG